MIQTFLDQTQRREAKTIKYRITFANHLKIAQTHLIEMCSIYILLTWSSIMITTKKNWGIMKKKSTSNHEMVMSSVSSNGNLKTSVELKIYTCLNIVNVIVVPAYLCNIKVYLLQVIDHHFIIAFKIHHAALVWVCATVAHLLESALAQKSQVCHLHWI